MFNRILVPLDGSKLSERALAPALALGQHAEGAVILLRVAAPESMLIPSLRYAGYELIWPDQALERARQEAGEYLETLRTVHSHVPLALRTEVLEGDIGFDVAGAIVDAAEERGADLIVMSTHGYSGITRWRLGSVTEKVLRAAPCPVVVIRTSEPVHHVLIALDGSELSEQALEPGLEVAAALGSRATLLRAIPRMDPDSVNYLDTIEVGLGRRMEEELRQEAEGYLADLAASHHRPGMQVDTAIVEEPAASAILDFAESRKVDLIAMSTHGRAGLRRWVYGSVTEKVMHEGCCSMLIVRPRLTG